MTIVALPIVWPLLLAGLALAVGRRRRAARTVGLLGSLGMTVASVALLVGLGAMIGKLLEVTGGTQVLADTLVGMAESPMQLVTDRDRYRPVDIPVLHGSNERIRTATGWTPQIPIEQTLADLLAECRTRVRAAGAVQAGRTSRSTS